jgi:hypothetical protein
MRNLFPKMRKTVHFKAWSSVDVKPIMKVEREPLMFPTQRSSWQSGPSVSGFEITLEQPVVGALSSTDR